MNNFQLLAVIVLIILTLVFLLRSKIINIISTAIPFIFAAFLLLSILSVFSKSIFESLSDQTLVWVGIKDVLINIDNEIPISEIKNTTINLLDNWNNLFGDNNVISDFEENGSVGYLMENLYPVLISLISIIYRAFVTIIGIVGMFFTTYLSYNSVEITRLKKLEKRIENLEKNS